jgi:hypothetical protein
MIALMRKPRLCGITPKRHASEALRLALLFAASEFLHGFGVEPPTIRLPVNGWSPAEGIIGVFCTGSSLHFPDYGTCR